MKKFLVELFSNRFGIVLAAINLCFFVSSDVVSRVFEHVHGDTCILFNSRIPSPLVNLQVPDLIMLQNLPALFYSMISSSLFEKLFPGVCAYTHIRFQVFSLLIFIVLQWLFVALIAKTLAAKLRRSDLK